MGGGVVPALMLGLQHAFVAQNLLKMNMKHIMNKVSAQEYTINYVININIFCVDFVDFLRYTYDYGTHKTEI